MYCFSRREQRRSLPPGLATLFAVLGCGSLQLSCDSERTRDVPARSSPAVSTPAPQAASSAQVPSAAPPASTPSPSADVPKPEYTVEEPRCAPNEADCLPEPYNGGEDMIVGTVTGAPYKYNAHAKRYPQSEGREDEGGCDHDGDCFARPGCLECVSRFRFPPSRSCLALYLEKMDGSFCGCVEKRCRWFTQRLTQRIVTSTKNLEVRLGGAPTSDAQLLSEAAELFDMNLVNCYYPRKHLLPARHRFVMTVGKYGEAETNILGVHRSVRKCVSDAFNDMTQTPSWISDDFLKHGEIRFTGVVEVKMGWVP
jgi:hypothetical protein